MTRDGQHTFLGFSLLRLREISFSRGAEDHIGANFEASSLSSLSFTSISFLYSLYPAFPPHFVFRHRIYWFWGWGQWLCQILLRCF